MVRWTSWLAGAVTFVLLTLVCAWRAYPPLPRVITLQLTLLTATVGTIEPIVSSGAVDAGDFLVVRYLDPTTAVFGYDYWGAGGPDSSPITFEPGSRHTLRIEMPAFAAIRGALTQSRAPLRLHFDGREILNQDVRFHWRDPSRIFFGQNPIGGTTSGGVFRGQIFTEDGKPLRGGPGVFFPWPRRLQYWLTGTPWQ